VEVALAERTQTKTEYNCRCYLLTTSNLGLFRQPWLCITLYVTCMHSRKCFPTSYELFPTCNRELWSKVIVPTDTHTHRTRRPSTLPRPLNWQSDHGIYYVPAGITASVKIRRSFCTCVIDGALDKTRIWSLAVPTLFVSQQC